MTTVMATDVAMYVHTKPAVPPAMSGIAAVLSESEHTLKNNTLRNGERDLYPKAISQVHMTVLVKAIMDQNRKLCYRSINSVLYICLNSRTMNGLSGLGVPTASLPSSSWWKLELSSNAMRSIEGTCWESV
jgi:hypothetical protein